MLPAKRSMSLSVTSQRFATIAGAPAHSAGNTVHSTLIRCSTPDSPYLNPMPHMHYTVSSIFTAALYSLDAGTLTVSQTQQQQGYTALPHLPSGSPKQAHVAHTRQPPSAAHCCTPLAGWQRSAPAHAGLGGTGTAVPHRGRSTGTGRSAGVLTGAGWGQAGCLQSPAARQ